MKAHRRAGNPNMAVPEKPHARQILLEDSSPDENDVNRFPEKCQATLVIMDAALSIFVPDSAQKTWSFPRYSHFLTDTS